MSGRNRFLSAATQLLTILTDPEPTWARPADELHVTDRLMYTETACHAHVLTSQSAYGCTSKNISPRMSTTATGKAEHRTGKLINWEIVHINGYIIYQTV